MQGFRLPIVIGHLPIKTQNSPKKYTKAAKMVYILIKYW